MAETKPAARENRLEGDWTGVPTFDATALDHIRELKQAGRENPVIRMIDFFLTRTPELIAQMQASLACGDTEEFQAAAHSLKSNSAFVGAMRVSEISKQLEYMARFDQWQGPEELLRVLEKEASRSQTILAEEKRREEN